ncbi:hypothetical protein [Aeoliella mucimassa]|uniref:VanZ-like domain-containing protein n=1 Tax=Aeoliella mucimassa TaxID=2527972 RepID=A0A518AI40_9BACT|nr:hypothetical protein [Aeoliella mucimassa]QDU54389.1 hypothetical protein Pan181_05700 [Aeoliella mucimassa]
MGKQRSLYFYAGVGSALFALSVNPLRQTAFGQSSTGRGLLGSAPSFFGVLALLMLLLAVIKPKSASMVWVTAIVVTAGTLAHEVLQKWNENTFDNADLIAIVCSFLVFCVLQWCYSPMKEL